MYYTNAPKALFLLFLYLTVISQLENTTRISSHERYPITDLLTWNHNPMSGSSTTFTRETCGHFNYWLEPKSFEAVAHKIAEGYLYWNPVSFQMGADESCGAEEIIKHATDVHLSYCTLRHDGNHLFIGSCSRVTTNPNLLGCKWAIFSVSPNAGHHFQAVACWTHFTGLNYDFLRFLEVWQPPKHWVHRETLYAERKDKSWINCSVDTQQGKICYITVG